VTEEERREGPGATSHGGMLNVIFIDLGQGDITSRYRVSGRKSG
jgi:hypothetical protein